MSLNTFLCYILPHNWTEEDHRPCERFKRCRRCCKEEINRGWHRFSNWSAPYDVEVYDSQGRKVTEGRQKRTCTDCNLINETVVLS